MNIDNLMDNFEKTISLSDMVESFEAGVTVDEIARTYHCLPRVITAILQDAGCDV